MGSSCSRTPVGHWAGVGALVVSLLLRVGGVASPYWRVVDGKDGSHYPVHEGLWQECYRRDGRTVCRFNGDSTDWWRAIQGVELASLLFLLFGVFSSFCSINVRGKSAAVFALCGGLTGLLGDLLYVGFTETRHSKADPGELAYAWSFALSTAGSIFALLASVALFSAVCCVPKFASRPVKPYGPYRHYSVDVDKHGRPRYYLHHSAGTLYPPNNVDRAFKGGAKAKGASRGRVGSIIAGSQPPSRTTPAPLYPPPPSPPPPSPEASYHRYPQPCPFPDPFQGGRVRKLCTAAERRREFYEKTRGDSRVKFAASDGALTTANVFHVPPATMRLLDPREDMTGPANANLLMTAVPPSPYPDYPSRQRPGDASEPEPEPRHKRVRRDNVDDVTQGRHDTSNSSGGSVPIKPSLDASRSSKPSPATPSDGKGERALREVITTADRMPSYVIASDDSGHASPSPSDEKQMQQHHQHPQPQQLQQQHQHRGRGVWAIGGARHDVSVSRARRLPVVQEDQDQGPFTIEKSIRESAGQVRPERTDQLHQSDRFGPEHLLWRRTEPLSFPTSVYLPHPYPHPHHDPYAAPRPWDHPRRPWRPWWWRRPGASSQERIVVKTRKGKLSLGSL